jgi:hypothetical protein
MYFHLAKDLHISYGKVQVQSEMILGSLCYNVITDHNKNHPNSLALEITKSEKLYLLCPM